LVQEYFANIRDLRAGKEEAVQQLVDLWDADGTFEFAGAPPVTGTFQGRNAIHVLYKNRFHANKMPLRFETAGGQGKTEAALGVVDTDVHRTRVVDDKLVAGWTTTIGTGDGRGFQVSGAHTFTFKNGKIGSLKVVISPRPETSEGLDFAGLSVNDIGRLALAAWPVV
jgi:ketosteroid isomerase-like protein